MSSPLGLMAPSIIDSDAVQGETFLPGQIFVFGGFALRANSLSMIVGAIKPNGDDIEELSMKAPMSVSKPADLG